MPAEEDYNRRQILQQQQHTSSNAASTSSSSVTQCSPEYLSTTDPYKVESNAPEARFGERSQSERLPPGERYQGVSERYPLGERPQTSISSERLAQDAAQNFQAEVYQVHRYPERYTPIGSLDRYHHQTVERVARTNTPLDRYHTLSTDKERCTKDRYTPHERYRTLSNDKEDSHTNHEQYRTMSDKDRYNTVQNNNERHSSNQNVCSIDLYSNTDRHRCDKIRDRSGSGERKENVRFQYQNQYQHENYVPYHHHSERFPPIPCPERFATQERVPYSQTYLEPPSPAPANDRFIPPPPLSPENTPTTPDCFTNNAFPSPTTSVPPPEPFLPPPPLTSSPTETFSPQKVDRRYQYSISLNSNDRYHHPDHSVHNYQEDTYVNVQQNPHMPVERYVPLPQQDGYYNGSYQYDRYSVKFNANDPYMRRDLASFHYRFPFPQNQYQRVRYIGTPNRVKCCQYSDGYQHSKSSPGSSSSSSVTSQNKEIVPCVNNVSIQEIQCQNYQNYHQLHQEKSTQCSTMCHHSHQSSLVSPNTRMVKGQCRHSMCASPSIEYVGASGGRHVCATPPPRGSICSQDGSMCGESCCSRRSQNSLTVSVWRTTPSRQNTSQSQSQEGLLQDESTRSATPNTTESNDQTAAETSASSTESNKSPILSSPPAVAIRNPHQATHSRAVSLPVTSASERERPKPSSGVGRPVDYSHSERIPKRPPLERSVSRKEVIKNYIKKETATFFGVDEENEQQQQSVWLDRRKRMASRAYGPLKDEYRTLSSPTHRRTVSEMPSRTTMSGQLMAERPDVLPESNDVPDNQESTTEASLRRKDSVARMTWDGLSYVVNTITRQRPRPRSQQAQWSRSYPPETPATEPLDEETRFFEQSLSLRPPSPKLLDGSAAAAASGDTVDQSSESEEVRLRRSEPYERYTRPPGQGGWRREVTFAGGRQGPSVEVGSGRIHSRCLDDVLDNSNRREYGMGWVGRTFGRSFRKSVAQDVNIKEQLDDLEDHRPMFTYWVTIVQILVFFISLACYGFGPFGIDLASRSGQVLVTSLSLQQVDYMEPANFWLGPRAADLIHLGAKFAPCMRLDAEIGQEIEKIRSDERETACCIRNDDSGCVQSSRADCSETISFWKRERVGAGGRISGSVCGLDPKFCDVPASVAPHEWPEDITQWPICRKTNTLSAPSQKRNGAIRDKAHEHMVCEIIGHPCCIGIHGKCKITTKEYCDFVRGAFHEEASLCSQVSCLNDVCGMLPFYFPDVPDQFYRLWTSIFLHAGIIQLAISIVIQYFLMRDLEKLTGSLRICIIYLGSGVAGNLASAIFVPYRADVGPSGSQFGLLASLIVEVIHVWKMLKHPHRALGKLLITTALLFLVGLLPWVDNYAHLFGFIFGFLLSFAMLPFISFGDYDRHKKIASIWICLLTTAILFVLLVMLFYIIPVYNCKVCSYLNCIPITRDFCNSQNIDFRREEPIV